MRKFFIKKGKLLHLIKWVDLYKYLISFVLFFKFTIVTSSNTLQINLINPKKYITNTVWFLKYYLKLFKIIKLTNINFYVLFKYLNKWKLTILQKAITNKC